MSTARFFSAQSLAVGYGSMITEDSPRKQGMAGYRDDLISRITQMILDLEPVRSELREFDWLFLWNKGSFYHLIDAYENVSSLNNDWPFNLDVNELKNFLLSINFNIRDFLEPNSRIVLLRNLQALTHRLSQTYMFTLEQCELIQNYKSIEWYQELDKEMTNLVKKLAQGEVDDFALGVFSIKINNLVDYFIETFGQFKPAKFEYRNTFNGPILANRLVILATQLKPFLDIGMVRKDYSLESNRDITAKPARP